MALSNVPETHPFYGVILLLTGKVKFAMCAKEVNPELALAGANSSIDCLTRSSRLLCDLSIEAKSQLLELVKGQDLAQNLNELIR